MRMSPGGSVGVGVLVGVGVCVGGGVLVGVGVGVLAGVGVCVGVGVLVGMGVWVLAGVGVSVGALSPHAIRAICTATMIVTAAPAASEAGLAALFASALGSVWFTVVAFSRSYQSKRQPRSCWMSGVASSTMLVASPAHQVEPRPGVLAAPPGQPAWRKMILGWRGNVKRS